jgi:hypothetical protein
VDVQYNGNARDGIPAFQDAAKKQFVGAAVIANYGSKRTYTVTDIRFDLGPCNTFFDGKDGQKTSVAKYFFREYKMKISDKRQPMLVVKAGGRDVSLPSEFCLVDGVPDSVRGNPMAMRNLLAKTRQNPQQKLDKIGSMINQLFKMQKWAEWDISVESEP